MIEMRATIRRGAFSLDIDIAAAGKVVCLFGRSGSGKTTVADLIAGVIGPPQGRIAIDGETVLDTRRRVHIPAWRRRIGYVFQDARLFPHLSVRDNLLYGARRRGAVKPPLDDTVDLLGLNELLGRRPHTLSGGEARRVAIGRALLSEPRLLILDEPLAGLDGARRGEILPYLERLAEAGPPILHITHSVEEAARLADEIVLVTDGRAFGAGSPAEAFRRFEAEAVAGLNAPLSILEGRAVGDPATSVDLGGVVFHTPPLDAPAGRRVRIVVNARDVALALNDPKDVSFQNRLAVRVCEVEDRPDGVLVRLEGTASLAALITRDAARSLGVAPGRRMVALVKATATATARYA